MGFAFVMGGIALAASLVIGLILFIVFAFFGNIIIFDCILAGVVSGICCNIFFTFHPAVCLLIGLIIFFAFIVIHNMQIGFWIIGGFMTAFYTFIAGYITYEVTNGDWIWVCVVSFLALLVVAALHFHAREKLQNKNGAQT